MATRGREKPDLSSVDPSRAGWQSGRTTAGQPCKIKLAESARRAVWQARQRSAAEARSLVPLRFSGPGDFEVFEVGPPKAARRNGAKPSATTGRQAGRQSADRRRPRDAAQVLRRLEVWEAARSSGSSPRRPRPTSVNTPLPATAFRRSMER